MEELCHAFREGVPALPTHKTNPVEKEFNTLRLGIVEFRERWHRVRAVDLNVHLAQVDFPNSPSSWITTVAVVPAKAASCLKPVLGSP